MKNREELLEELQIIMDDAWGEDEEVTEGLFNICNENFELCKKIIEEDKTFNRYTYCVNSWSDLAYEIVNDEAFLGDEESADYLEAINRIKDNEQECKECLFKQGWRLDLDFGVAFGFDIKDLKKEGYSL